MKHRVGLGAAVAVALASASTPALADIVTFDATATPGDGLTGNGTTYTEAGLLFTSNYSGGLFHYGSKAPGSYDSNGAALLSRFQGGTITVSSVTGGTFDLISIGLGSYYGPLDLPNNDLLPFSYTIDGLTTDTSISYVAGKTLVTSNVNLKNVSQFVLTQNVQNNPGFLIDNIVFTPYVAAVPEAATWVMMILGFGMVGGTMRYRRRAAPVACA